MLLARIPERLLGINKVEAAFFYVVDVYFPWGRGALCKRKWYD